MKKNIKQIKERLWRAEEVSAKTRVFDEVACLKPELNVLLDKEEKMWPMVPDSMAKEW